jgi:hypothetical protein
VFDSRWSDDQGGAGPAMADQQPLNVFAQWVAGCSGNEKQEAQTFVQRLLSAWAQEEFMARKSGMGRAAVATGSNYRNCNL